MRGLSRPWRTRCGSSVGEEEKWCRVGQVQVGSSCACRALQRLIPCKKAQLKHNHDFIQSPAFFFTMFHHFSAVAWREVRQMHLFLERRPHSSRIHKIKGPDNPTSQFLPIMSNTCCSGDGEGRKDKGGGGGLRSKTNGMWRVVCDKVLCERWCVTKKDGVCVWSMVCERWCVKDGVR